MNIMQTEAPRDPSSLASGNRKKKAGGEECLSEYGLHFNPSLVVDKTGAGDRKGESERSREVGRKRKVLH